MAKDKKPTTHNFRTMRSDFSCPLSPEVPWYWGLRYKECPLASDQRNMGACKTCILRGESYSKQKRKRKEKEITVERRTKEDGPLPKIKGTYSSE